MHYTESKVAINCLQFTVSKLLYKTSSDALSVAVPVNIAKNVLQSMSWL